MMAGATGSDGACTSVYNPIGLHRCGSIKILGKRKEKTLLTDKAIRFFTILV